MFYLSLLLAFTSFLILSLTNKKHAAITQLNAAPSNVLVVVLHISAYAVMGLSLQFCIALWQLEIGVVVWVGILQLSSVLVSAVFTYLPSLYKTLCNYILLVAFWGPLVAPK